MQPKTFGSSLSQSKDKLSLKDRTISSITSTREREKMFRDNPPALATQVYIIEYKR
jgi:hypothetical protein